jgi:hypothetical protein
LDELRLWEDCFLVRRPLGLCASARSADGTILAEPSTPAYIRRALERIAEGRAAGGRTDPHRLTILVKGRIDARLGTDEFCLVTRSKQHQAECAS